MSVFFLTLLNHKPAEAADKRWTVENSAWEEGLIIPEYIFLQWSYDVK